MSDKDDLFSTIHSRLDQQIEKPDVSENTVLRDLSGALRTEGKNLKGMNFSGADLSGMDLRGADLEGAVFFKASLKETDMANANLRNAEFTGADLTGAHLEEADLSKAGLGMANLTGARLFSANLTYATLTGANLEEADLRHAKLDQARIREANLRKADFTGANLFAADMTRARVEKATFLDADLQRANLYGITGFEKANWVGVDMREINFSGAYLLHRFARDQNYIKEFRERSRFSEYLYYLWWITSDCGRSISRWLVLICMVALMYASLYTKVGIDYGPHEKTWFTPIYYSVVTMSSLGYGEIVPLSPAGQMLAVSEVLVGYIMLGGLLAILSNKLVRRAD